MFFSHAGLTDTETGQMGHTVPQSGLTGFWVNLRHFIIAEMGTVQYLF